MRLFAISLILLFGSSRLFAHEVSVSVLSICDLHGNVLP